MRSRAVRTEIPIVALIVAAGVVGASDGCGMVLGADFDNLALAPGPETCAHALVPPMPDGGTQGRSIPDFVIASRPPDGGPADTPDGPPAYKLIGYDMDHVCTGEGQGPSCDEPTWANADHTDGPDGRDNAAGQLFYELQSEGQTIAGTAFEGSPAWVPLLRVRGYDGEPDDPQVDVSYYVGSELANADAANGGLPRFDGTDIWNVDASELQPDPMGHYDLDHSLLHDPQAYVSGGILVSHLSTALLFSPHQEPGKTVDAWTIGRLVQNTAGQWEIRDGLTSCRLPLDQIFPGLSGFDDPIDPMHGPLCLGSASYAALKPQICALADISAAGNDPSLPCDAISSAESFSGSPAQLNGIRIRQPLPRRCPPARDPANDKCP